MRVRPVQASSAAAAAQQSRFRALRHRLPPCGRVHGGAGHYVGCRRACCSSAAESLSCFTSPV